MPYIITTTERSECRDRKTGATITQSTRRAVATLDEARDAVIAALPDPDEGWSAEALNVASLVPESGGTVGPLPDGTVIEVAQVRWDHLREVALLAGFGPIVRDIADGGRPIIDAYNAAQS